MKVLVMTQMQKQIRRKWAVSKTRR